LDNTVETLYPGETSGPFVRQLGYVVLGAGVIGGVLVLVNFGTVEVPEFTSMGLGTPRTVSNPLGITLGILIIAQSVILSAICIALGSAAENTAILRREALATRFARETAPSGERAASDRLAQG